MSMRLSTIRWSGTSRNKKSPAFKLSDVDNIKRSGYNKNEKADYTRFAPHSFKLRNSRRLWKGTGGYFFFMFMATVTHSVATPIITAQNWNNSEYVTCIGNTPSLKKGKKCHPSIIRGTNRPGVSLSFRRYCIIEYYKNQQEAAHEKCCDIRKI